MRVRSLKSFLPSSLLMSGKKVGIRFIRGEDGRSLQSYFRALSRTSRYNRFMGDVAELSPRDLERATAEDGTDEFTVVAEVQSGDTCEIIGEARYVFDQRQQCGEFGLSVDDGWQQRGIGVLLMNALERCASAMGAKRLIGEVLQSNDKMKKFGRKAGFALLRIPGEWTTVRLEKQLDNGGLAMGQ